MMEQITGNLFLIVFSLILGSSGLWTVIQLLIQRFFSKKDKEDVRFKELEVRFRQLEDEDNKIESALTAILHDRIYQSTKYFIHKNSIPPSAMKNLERLMQPYEAFGGNGTARELFLRCKKLPLEDEE